MARTAPGALRAALPEHPPRWRILAPVRLQTLVLRHEPPGLDAAAADAHTRPGPQAINDSGSAYLTTAVIAERWAVRVSIGAASTERKHVADLWRLIQEKAAGRPGA